uniref:Uncharacterized protein n=1 Tax=viral metagenome TaxID=1070528 RepID=A0A6M3JGB5_9ZZZZ
MVVGNRYKNKNGERMGFFDKVKNNLLLRKTVLLARNIDSHQGYINRAEETISITKEWLRKDTEQLKKMVKLFPKEELLKFPELVRWIK